MNGPTTTILLINVIGEELIQRRIDSVVANTDLTPAMEKIRTELHAAFEESLASEGRSNSQPYAPLSPRYRRWKQKHYPGQPILSRTRRMRRSFQKGGAANISEVGPLHATVGSRVRTPKGRWYLAALHQEGTRRMPRRRLGHLNPALRDKLLQHVHDHLWGEP